MVIQRYIADELQQFKEDIDRKGLLKPKTQISDTIIQMVYNQKLVKRNASLTIHLAMCTLIVICSYIKQVGIQDLRTIMF